MASTTTDIGDVISKLVRILTPLDMDEQRRAVQAAQVALGIETTAAPTKNTLKNTAREQVDENLGSVANYFSQKDPQTKSEKLAVAARFRELETRSDAHTMQDLKRMFESARTSFDKANFARDIDNARRKAPFFVLGGARGKYSLSHYGQNFVDALPDRQEAQRIPKPRTRSKGQKRSKTKG